MDYGGRMGAVSVNFGTGVATGVGLFSGINRLTGNTMTSLILNTGDDTVQITGIGAGNVNSGQLLYSSVQNLDGAGGSNTLIGRNAANVFAVTGANSGTVDGLIFSNFGNLTGNAGDDLFQFSTGGNLSGSVNGAAGTNTLEGDDNNRTWTLNGNFSGLVGGLLSSFSAIQNLVGGDLNDTFNIADGGNINSFNGGLGLNRLDYSSRTGVVSVTFSAGSGSATGIASFSSIGALVGNGQLSLSLGSGNDLVQITGMNAGDVNSGELLYSNVLSVDGGLGVNTLVGRNVVNHWNLTGAGAGSVDGLGFNNFSQLSGGGDDDHFVMNDGSLFVLIQGGGGTTNTLDYGSRMGAVSVNFGTGVATGVAGFSGVNRLIGNAMTSLILNTGDDTVQITGVGAGNVNSGQFLFSSVQSLDGAGGSNTLIGRNAANVFAVTGANSGTVDGLSFSNFGSLTGNVAADQFQLQAGGSLSGSINGNGGVNSLTYAGRVTAVSVNLQTGAATSLGGTFANISSITGGGSLADVLTGANAVQTWTINGANSGDVGGVLTFVSFENLNGGSLADSFDFVGTGALTGSLDAGAGSDSLNLGAAGLISGNVLMGDQDDFINMGSGGSIGGSLDGGIGTDSLSYAGRASVVSVDLANFSATAIFGGLASGFSRIEVVTGGSNSGDTLTGRMWRVKIGSSMAAIAEPLAVPASASVPLKI
ncbi:MAG: calcium-binding protein [Blastochloris sp.]|nr:calcium-binding protein [Blastochloris sp.]